MRLVPLSMFCLAAILGLTFLPQLTAQDAPPAETPPEDEDATAADAAPAEQDATEPTTEEIKAAIANLNSDNFRVREDATKKLWEMGRAAEPLLREAVENDRGELRYRGEKLLEEFELGLYPDTPEAIRKLVLQYREGDLQARAAAVRELARLDQTDLLSRLVRRERDPDMRSLIAEILGDGVQRLAPAHIAKGEFEKAENLLRIAALATRGMQNYAAFLAGTGKLKAAIIEQRKIADDSVVDTELYAWMLRVDGQLEEAARQFEEAGQSINARHTLAATGAPLAFAESCVDHSKADIATLGYQLAAARLANKTETANTLLATIDEYARAIPDESEHCVSALILNGYADRALALARRVNPGDLSYLALDRYHFEEAFSLLGSPNTVAPYDDWLKRFTAELKIEKEVDIPEALEPVERMITACISTAQKDEAVRILASIIRRLEKDNWPLLDIVKMASQNGLMDFAIETSVKAMELETEIATVSALYYTEDSADNALHGKIWEHLRDNKPDQSDEAALRQLGALIGYSGLGDADAAPIIASMRAVADAGEPARKGELLLFAADFAMQQSDLDSATDAYAAAIEHIGVNVSLNHRFKFADALFRAKRYREAAEQFDIAAARLEGSATPVYFKGLALERAGDIEEGKTLRERAALMTLGNSFAMFDLALYAYAFDETDVALSLSRIAARLSRPDALPSSSPDRRPYINSPYDLIHRIHVGRREFAEAAEALEITNLIRIRNPFPPQEVISSTYALSNQMEFGKIKARALLEAEKVDEAVALAHQSLDLNPADSSMLEDVYQMLVDKEKVAEADAMFETVYAQSLRAAETFPARGQFHNNVAWLLSRTGKKLDQALQHANTAVELEPENGAFLDTLAEVHFQRGDREQAVAASEKAITFLGNDPQLEYQLERFKNGKPTDR